MNSKPWLVALCLTIAAAATYVIFLIQIFPSLASVAGIVPVGDGRLKPLTKPLNGANATDTLSVHNVQRKITLIEGFKATFGLQNPCQTLGRLNGSRMKKTITFLVQNPRTGSFFLSNRIKHYGSGNYEYHVQRVKDLKPRPTKSVEAFLNWSCAAVPGPKVIVWDAGATPNFELAFWPAQTALVITGDEAGRWGLYDSKRYESLFSEL